MMNENKQKILTSLQQLGVNIAEMQDKPMAEFVRKTELPLKKTYSVKVVAVKDGEIGVLSKRLEMKNKSKQDKSKQQLSSNDKTNKLAQSAYVINNYFYPKQLKSIRRQNDLKEEEYRQKLLKWQAEQYEKLKGQTDNHLPEIDETGDKEIVKQQLVIPGLGSLKRRDMQPQVKRMLMGQQIRTKDMANESQYSSNQTNYSQQQQQEVYAIIHHDQNPYKKFSYSRLLADLTEKDILDAPQQILFASGMMNTKNQSPNKEAGIIYELEEENEGSPDVNEVKLPQIGKKIATMPFEKDDNMHKRLKKFHNHLNVKNG